MELVGGGGGGAEGEVCIPRSQRLLYLFSLWEESVWRSLTTGKILYSVLWDLFSMMDCEKITKNYIFLVHFYTHFPNIYFMFWRNEK